MKLFIALTFDELTTARMTTIQQQLSEELSQSDAMRPENLHLTLVFIGNVDEEDVFAIEDALDTVRSSTQFSLTFDHVQAHEETTWLVPRQCDALSRLQAEIERTLRELGLELEGRPFAPHVTLFRNATPADSASNAANEALASDPIVASITSFSLMESRTEQGKLVYESLCEWE